jgi:uncharacterized protein (TIGR02145 family)
MTVASEITRLQGVKSNILDAIAAKGVTVPSGAMLADCPDLIASITGGGGTIQKIVQPVESIYQSVKNIELSNNSLKAFRNRLGYNIGSHVDISAYTEVVFKTRTNFHPYSDSTAQNAHFITRALVQDDMFIDIEWNNNSSLCWNLRIPKSASELEIVYLTSLTSTSLLENTSVEVLINKSTRQVSIKVNGTYIYNDVLSFTPYFGTNVTFGFGKFAGSQDGCLTVGDWIDLSETFLIADGNYLIGQPSSGGGGFEADNIVNIVPIDKMVVVDANGYIGFDLTNYFQYRGSTFYYNYAILSASDDFSSKGMGQVTFYTPTSNVIGGRTYRTVVIGGVEWLAENLDFKFSGLAFGQSGTSSSEPRGNYYQNNSSSYGKYGILYNWIAVKYLEDNKSSLIPGWHVPTTAEWDALATAVGGTSVAGTKLKSTTNWSSGAGTDDYGFSAFPAGNYYGSFNGLGSNAYFWTATESSSSSAYRRYFSTGASMSSSDNGKNSQYSVRLVKDNQ